MYGIVGPRTEKPKLVQFPFAKSRERLADTISKCQVHLAGEEVVRLVEQAEPYEGGSDLLSGLHALDIADKHRLILTTGRTAPVSMASLIEAYPWIPLDYEPGAELVYCGTGSVILDIKIPRVSRRVRRANGRYVPERHESKFQPPFLIAFGNSEPLPGGTLISTLLEMAQVVERLCTNLCRASAG
jgi:hypothetical protein